MCKLYSFYVKYKKFYILRTINIYYKLIFKYITFHTLLSNINVS